MYMNVFPKSSRGIILLICFLILSGCFLRKFKNEQVDIIISPRTAFYRQDRACLLFFSSIYPSETLAEECSIIFQKTFLKYKVFKIIEQIDSPLRDEEYLINIARERGFDILIKGNLNDFFLAHDQEASRAGLSLKVYDLKTGSTIWYMDLADKKSGKQGFDWIFGKTKPKQPPSPYAILRQMAKETSKIMLMSF